MKILLFALAFAAFAMMAKANETPQSNIVGFSLFPEHIGNGVMLPIQDIVENDEGELVEVVTEARVVGFTYVVKLEDMQTLELVSDDDKEAFLACTINGLMTAPVEGGVIDWEPVEKSGLVIPEVDEVFVLEVVENDDEVPVADDVETDS